VTRPATQRHPVRHAPGARRTPFVLLLGGLVVGGLCALLALNTASAANEVQRHDLALRDQNIAARVVQLQNDQQASAAPANLARAAEALGMVPAGNPGFLEMGTDGQVRVVGKAAPATAAPLPVPTPAPTHAATHHKKKPDNNKPDKKRSDKKKSDANNSDNQKKDNQKKDNQKNKNKRRSQTSGASNNKHDRNSGRNSDSHSPKSGPHKHAKHRTQSRHERPAGAPTTTITIPGGPR
jgi:outer membrane biosynthesis protein TonB